tara:strand:+ start:564 stop:851 length:288 start_codon:yes stop_codon:yes gene_type:complete
MADPKAFRTEREWLSATVPSAKSFPKDKVDHPDHYGGEENLYEAIKIIEAYDLNFSLGNSIKYILRAGKKNDNVIEDLQKASWYIQRQIEFLEQK